MTPRLIPAATLAVSLALAGCSASDSALFPSLAGEDPSGEPPQQVEIAPSAGETAATATAGTAGSTADSQPPQLGQGEFEPDGVTAGQSTGTEVGRRVEGLRTDLTRLQDNIRGQNEALQSQRADSVAEAERYHGLIAAIQSRLQVGTTPGNPIVVQQWTDAQQSLASITTGIGTMNQLSNQVADSSAFASFLLESTRASYGLTGAVDEDHRQLAILEDEVNRTVVLIDRLLTELNEDITRQTNYVGRERGNLAVLSVGVKNGELFADSLPNRAFASAAPFAAGPAARSGATGRPLVVIRFDRENVAYADPLYSAASQALERRPGASFEVVAVAPTAGTPSQVALNANSARRSAEDVRRTLTQFGLPASRVTLSATTSQAASVPEVHVFLR